MKLKQRLWIDCAVSAHLIYAFVFAHAKKSFLKTNGALDFIMACSMVKTLLDYLAKFDHLEI